jgi:hypothetical protein
MGKTRPHVSYNYESAEKTHFEEKHKKRDEDQYITVNQDSL